MIFFITLTIQKLVISMQLYINKDETFIRYDKENDREKRERRREREKERY